MSERTEEIPNPTSFADLGLSPETLRAVDEAGFESPTPIQERAIPILLAGEDLVAEAQTGTGKTAAFALPLVQRRDPGVESPQALVVCPTRELAVQDAEAIYALGRVRGFRVLPVYGGQPIDRQLRALHRGVHIVVGTPGRLQDHIRRGTLDLSHIATVILDEADEMLDMGFVEEIESILDALPEERQIGLFSATIPPPIARLAGKYLRDPRRVAIAAEPHTIPQIRQSYYEVSPAHKLDALTRILDMETPGPTIIFCGMKREADALGEHLRGRGYLAEALHGDLSQAERDRAMGRFRQGQTDLLVATDVAARGLDIESVTHVINYDIPWDADSYTHRIGRTGRAGREGDAITLVGPWERRQLKMIERATGARITPVRLPSSADIAARRRDLFKQSVVEVLEEGEFDEFLITVQELAEQYEASEVGAAALKLLWAQRLPGVSAQEVLPEDDAPVEPGMARLLLTVGRRDGIRPGDLVGAIANEAGVPGRAIGAIDILDDHAFVEVPRESANRVMEALEHTTLRGQRVRVEQQPASDEAPPRPSREPAGLEPRARTRREPADTEPRARTRREPSGAEGRPREGFGPAGGERRAREEYRPTAPAGRLRVRTQRPAGEEQAAPPQTVRPSASRAPAGPERRERPERAEASARAEAPARAERRNRPERERPARTEAPARAERRERPEMERPGRAKAPTRAERRAHLQRERPEGSEAPASRERPERERPERGQAPAGAERRERPERERPERGQTPAGAERPAPAEGERPGAGEQARFAKPPGAIETRADRRARLDAKRAAKTQQRAAEAAAAKKKAPRAGKGKGKGHK